MSPDTRIDRLLDLLMDHATVVVSGTRMAAEIGVPRSTLRGWVLRLRELGVELHGIHSAGYRLARIPDILTPQVIRRAAHGTSFGARVHHFFKSGSTMDDAADLAAAGEPHGSLVLAEEQTAGRGRLGHKWHSEKGAGLYLALILRPPLPAAAAPILTLAAGLGVAKGLAEVLGDTPGLEADIRWPNDVLVGGRKCSGILLEMNAEPERIKHVILGIGVNVNHSRLPGNIASEATSLRLIAGRAFSRAEVLAAVLRGFDRSYRRLLEPDGRARTVAEFERRSSFARGRRVSVEEDGVSVAGTTAGLDPAGYLLVRREDNGKTGPVYTGKLRALE